MSKLSLDISNKGDECKFTLNYGETKVVTKFDFEVTKKGDDFTEEQLDLIREGVGKFMEGLVEKLAFNLYQKLKGDS